MAWETDMLDVSQRSGRLTEAIYGLGDGHADISQTSGWPTEAIYGLGSGHAGCKSKIRQINRIDFWLGKKINEYKSKSCLNDGRKH